MTTPTREQVVQWIGQTNIKFDYLCLSEDDSIEYEYFATLARADLEATIAEQAAEIERLITYLAEIRDEAGPWFEHPEAMGDPGEVVTKVRQLRQQLAAQQAYAEQLLALFKSISEQTPEKPDYWSSCGQCERNISDAEEIAAIPHDTTVLQEYGKKLVEKVAQEAVNWGNVRKDDHGGNALRNFAAEILSIDWSKK